MDREKLRAAITHLPSLPTLPHIRERVVRLMENPQSSANDVSAIVSADPVLMARLLHTVDWRRTIFADKVPTASKAIRVLGFEALRRLIETQDVAHGVGRSVGSMPFALPQLWQHAVATAVAARAVAAHIGYPDPEECYVAGLLHDIGKLALLQLFPDRFYATIEQAARTHNTFYFCEVESGEASHAVYGRILLEQWELPPKVIEAVGLHHTPHLATTHLRVVTIVHVADIMARALGYGSGGDPFVPPPKQSAVSGLGLKTTQIGSVMAELQREFPKAASFLR